MDNILNKNIDVFISGWFVCHKNYKIISFFVKSLNIWPPSQFKYYFCGQYFEWKIYTYLI